MNGTRLLASGCLIVMATAATGATPPAVPAAVAGSAVVEATASPDALIGRIEVAIAGGLLDVARDLIARSSASLPPQQVVRLGAEYALASGSFEEAATGFATLTGDPVLGGAAQLGLGLARLRLGQTPQAIAALDAALASNPASVRGWVARGVAADRIRDWPNAETAYARAITLDPASASAYTNRGYSQLLRGRFVEAASDSTRALAIDPKSDVARNNLRLAQAMQGDYKNAFKGSTKQSMAKDLNTVGFAAMSRGDYGIAETFFTRAMQTNPQFDRIAWDNLVYLKQLAHKPLEPGPELK